jgi:hypothetical protein
MTTMTCTRFDDQFAALMEGDVPPAERQLLEAHAEACERCGPLLAGVRDVVREAGALPELQPSRDLWSGIAARIEAPVVEIEPRQAPAPVRRAIPLRLAAAAAAVLVALTAVTTWQLMGGNGTAEPARVAEAIQPDTGTTALAAATGDTPVVVVPQTVDAPVTSRPANRPAPAVAAPNVRNATNAVDVTGLYDREIASLRRMLESRRGELDTATVRVLEENLTIIDRAIDQSRQALATDPNSQFLVDHLNTSLGRKVQLLRTVTLLPASS